MILSYFLPPFFFFRAEVCFRFLFPLFFLACMLLLILFPLSWPLQRGREKGEEKRTEIDGEERKGGMSPPVRFADVCLSARLNYTISPFYLFRRRSKVKAEKYFRDGLMRQGLGKFGCRTLLGRMFAWHLVRFSARRISAKIALTGQLTVQKKRR